MSVTQIGEALKNKGYDNMQIANCLIMCRPKSADEGDMWIQNNMEASKAQIAGQLVPSHWNLNVDYMWAHPDTPFEIGEVVVLKRSDGTTRFGLLQKQNDPEKGVHTIIVAYGEQTNSVKACPAQTIGKLTLEPPPPSDGHHPPQGAMAGEFDT